MILTLDAWDFLKASMAILDKIRERSSGDFYSDEKLAKISAPVLAAKLVPFLPTVIYWEFLRSELKISRNRLIFKPPARPLSEVIKMMIWFGECFSASSVCLILPDLVLTSAIIPSRLSEYGLPDKADSWAFLILAAATSSIAWVTFWVFSIDLILFLISRIWAIF